MNPINTIGGTTFSPLTGSLPRRSGTIDGDAGTDWFLHSGIDKNQTVSATATFAAGTQLNIIASHICSHILTAGE